MARLSSIFCIHLVAGRMVNVLSDLIKESCSEG